MPHGPSNRQPDRKRQERCGIAVTVVDIPYASTQSSAIQRAPVTIPKPPWTDDDDVFGERST